MNNLTKITKNEDNVIIEILAKNSFIIKFILLTILGLLFLMLIWGIILSIYTDSFGPLSFVIIIIFCGLFIYPFFKITMWQVYGKETFTITKTKVNYEAFFKLLYTQKREYLYENLELKIVDLNDEDKVNLVRFKFIDTLKEEKNGNNLLQNALLVSEDEFTEIQNSLQEIGIG